MVSDVADWQSVASWTSLDRSLGIVSHKLQTSGSEEA